MCSGRKLGGLTSCPYVNRARYARTTVPQCQACANDDAAASAAAVKSLPPLTHACVRLLKTARKLEEELRKRKIWRCRRHNSLTKMRAALAEYADNPKLATVRAAKDVAEREMYLREAGLEVKGTAKQQTKRLVKYYSRG